jgi:hypothetical protein
MVCSIVVVMMGGRGTDGRRRTPARVCGGHGRLIIHCQYFCCNQEGMYGRMFSRVGRYGRSGTSMMAFPRLALEWQWGDFTFVHFSSSKFCLRLCMSDATLIRESYIRNDTFVFDSCLALEFYLSRFRNICHFVVQTTKSAVTVHKYFVILAWRWSFHVSRLGYHSRVLSFPTVDDPILSTHEDCPLKYLDSLVVIRESSRRVLRSEFRDFSIVRSAIRSLYRPRTADDAAARASTAK